MTHRHAWVGFIALLLGATALPLAGQTPAVETATTAPAVTVIEALTYVQRGDRELELDLVRPTAGAGPFPAIVCLFGGGWISGHRGAVRERCEYIAAQGYVVVAPDYRLAPADPYPAAVADVRECVRWLRRNAATYQVDPARIGAMGYSAGGHLACMLGVTSDDDRFGADDASADGVSARVQAVVNFFGPGDLAAADWSPLAVKKYLVPFLEGTADEKPQAYRAASPIHYITPDDPPVLTFQGDADRTVPLSQAKNLHARLDAAHVPNQLVIVEGAGHGWGEPRRSATRKQMMEFWKQRLGGAPVAHHEPAGSAGAAAGQAHDRP